MKKFEDIKNKLSYERKNFWKTATKKEQKTALKFAEQYKTFLDKCKTVRETVDFYKEVLTEKGFKTIGTNSKAKKVFAVSKNKNVAIAVIGSKPVSEGVNIIASHIDSPHIDLRQSPLTEDGTTGFGLLKTHYYGGIKKYQWLSTPLALHGVFVKNNGETVNVSIGEKDTEPVFLIPDLLPHLAKDQMSNKVGQTISGEKMNVIFNSIPMVEKDEKISQAVKLNALQMLNDAYGVTEEDFLYAELELVPAGKARDAGFDKSMIAAYGQDDRICSYTAAEAIFDAYDLEKTAIVMLFDKEEVGSDGNTGATSIFFEDFVCDLLKHNNEDFDSYNLRKTLINSQILSADVCVGMNPNFPEVLEKDNAVHLGCGVGVCKYTGSRGKSGTSDANAEFVAKVSKIFNQEKVNWQTGMLGKVDQGGGGTIAKFLTRYGSEVLDCGTGLIGMHSLYELCSKADLYSTYKAYKAFFLKA